MNEKLFFTKINEATYKLLWKIVIKKFYKKEGPYGAIPVKTFFIENILSIIKVFENNNYWIWNRNAINLRFVGVFILFDFKICLKLVKKQQKKTELLQNRLI